MTENPLSLRHLRFVTEYLRDGNATRAYVRAGYSARGAQSCASRLLAQPHIGTALAAGRQRIAESLEITVERVAQEYARIAFAPIDADLDHAKALQATRLKLQALAALTRHIELFAAKPQPGLTAEDRERYEARLAEHERQWQHSLQARRTLAHERDTAQIALAAAEAKLAAAQRAEPQPLQSIARPELAEPSPPPLSAVIKGIPPCDSEEFRELLGQLRRGTLEPVMARRMTRAGYGDHTGPEREKPNNPYQVECDYDPFERV
jgi:phage terminase small subunit